MSIIDWIKNLLRQKWYHKDEWVKVETKYIPKIEEKHDCPSWDITDVKMGKYKHKESCETRWRELNRITGMKTVFEDPHAWSESLHSDLDIYDGSKYE